MKPSHELTVERVHDEGAGAIVFRMSGVLGETQACYTFLDEVRKDVASFPPRIVVNLSGVQRMTSPGVGVLAACWSSAQNAGKKMCLAAVPKVALHVLMIAGLAGVIPVFPTEAEALRG